LNLERLVVLGVPRSLIHGEGQLVLEVVHPRDLELEEAALLISLNEYDNPGPCLGMAWDDTDNPVY